MYIRIKNIWILFCYKLYQSIVTSYKVIFKSKKGILERVDITKPILLLGNGPSLSLELSNLNYDDYEFMVVNQFALSTYFNRLKPKNYIISDPMYFSDILDSAKSTKQKLFSIFNEVNWDLSLYCRRDSTSYLKKYINNDHISFVEINSDIEISGFSFIKNSLIDRQLGFPSGRNVLNGALILLIWLGFKRIYLLGADHDMFKQFEVDKKSGKIYSVVKHFYTHEVSKRHIRPFEGKLYDWLVAFGLMFKGYEEVYKYANHRNVQIINCTQKSFIQTFEKISISDINLYSHE